MFHIAACACHLVCSFFVVVSGASLAAPFDAAICRAHGCCTVSLRRHPAALLCACTISGASGGSFFFFFFFLPSSAAAGPLHSPTRRSTPPLFTTLVMLRIVGVSISGGGSFDAGPSITGAVCGRRFPCSWVRTCPPAPKASPLRSPGPVHSWYSAPVALARVCRLALAASMFSTATSLGTRSSSAARSFTCGCEMRQSTVCAHA
mmetsp:Transcript_24205/g.82681  ORF Transcript_24205/g.82681 Transcript_24205/m.82681 type:complete len:205 (-) Transcript_24205:707-1321(-)